MKILMFAPYCYPVPGGQESHLYELVRALEKEGVEVELITRYNFSDSKINTTLFYLKSFFSLFRKQFDIVHGHDVHVGFVLMVYKWFSKKRSVLTVHSSIFLETYRRFPWLYKKMFSRQSVIFSTSNEIKEACEAVTDRPTVFISNGIDTEKFRPDRNSFLKEKFSIKKTDKIIITTRRLDKKNNVIALARAFDKVSRRRQDIWLVIVGDGEQRRDIKEIKNSRIIITGFVDNKEIQKHLNSADIFAIPSLYEANSISCLEAMACGLPILGTSVGGLPDLIKNNGILCEPSIRGIELGLEKILNCNISKFENRSRLMASKYSWNKLVKDYLRYYHSISNRYI